MSRRGRAGTASRSPLLQQRDASLSRLEELILVADTSVLANAIAILVLVCWCWSSHARARRASFDAVSAPSFVQTSM